MASEYVPIQEAAKKTRISEEEIRRRVRAGALPCTLIDSVEHVPLQSVRDLAPSPLPDDFERK